MKLWRNERLSGFREKESIQYDTIEAYRKKTMYG